MNKTMDHDKRKRLRDYVEKMDGSFEPLTESTHQVRAFSFEGKEYILKRQMLSADRLSPFWKLMKWVFASDFSVQRQQMPALIDFLKSECILKVPEFLFADEERGIQVLERCQGYGYEPDQFPKEVSFQLGEFIASLHRHTFSSGGTFAHHPCKDLKQRMDLAAERLIEEVWGNAKELRIYWKQIKEIQFSQEKYVLMMTDISANQFLFSQSFDRLEAVVDLDAYVIGPREWELAVLKECVTDWKAFQLGYETRLPFPEAVESYRYYTFLMALCDPWNPSAVKKCLSVD